MPVSCDVSAHPVESAIRELVGAFADEHHCPSIAWGLVGADGLISSGSTGQTSGGPVTAQTIYRIASMTKSFTAALVLSLRDDGVLGLDDAISVHAPELAAVTGPTADAAPITIRDLLSMSSGLATDDAWADRHLDLTDDELDRIVDGGVHLSLPTGSGFEYSNLGFALLGRVVLRATGRRVQDLVTDRLILPLGLERTTWRQPDHDDWARPLRWQDATHHPERPPLDDGVLAPMGGIWSCVDDLAQWVRWLDDAFPARDGADDGPLSRASRRDMQQMHRYAGMRELGGRRAPHGYGYGLLMRDDPTLGLVAGHSGGLPGYGSNMRWLPGRRLGVIALANVTYAPMAELTMRILDALDAAGELPVMETSVDPALEDAVRRLVALLGRWDDADADALFADNLVMDDSYERRVVAAGSALGVGPFTVERIVAANAGTAVVHVANGAGAQHRLELALAPLLPARIQSFGVVR